MDPPELAMGPRLADRRLAAILNPDRQIRRVLRKQPKLCDDEAIVLEHKPKIGAPVVIDKDTGPYVLLVPAKRVKRWNLHVSRHWRIA